MWNGVKTMTNKIKNIIATLVIFQIILFLFAGIFLQGITDKKYDELDTYYARKDEMQSQQQSLQGLVAELNKTLVVEKKREQDLSTQLAAIKSGNNGQTGNTPDITIPTRPAPPTPTPTAPPPVTSAS